MPGVKAWFFLFANDLSDKHERSPHKNEGFCFIYRPSSWNAFGMDKEGQDYRACEAYDPMYKNIRK